MCKKYVKNSIVVVTATMALVILLIIAVNTGSIDILFGELLKGLLVEYNQNVARIYDLRMPRIVLAMLAGASLSVSGVLFQAVMRNPLADTGILGISAGAEFVSVLCLCWISSFYFCGRKM